jgi:hypothetical protein
MTTSQILFAAVVLCSLVDNGLVLHNLFLFHDLQNFFGNQPVPSGPSPLAAAKTDVEMMGDMFNK